MAIAEFVMSREKARTNSGFKYESTFTGLQFKETFTAIYGRPKEKWLINEFGTERLVLHIYFSPLKTFIF